MKMERSGNIMDMFWRQNQIGLAIRFNIVYERKKMIKIFYQKTEQMELLLSWKEYGRNRLGGTIRIARNSCALHICTTDRKIKILKARTNYYIATMLIIFIRVIHKHSNFLSGHLVVSYFIQFELRCSQVTICS